MTGVLRSCLVAAADPVRGPFIGAGSDQAKQVEVEMYPWQECRRKMAGYAWTESMVSADTFLNSN